VTVALGIDLALRSTGWAIWGDGGGGGRAGRIRTDLAATKGLSTIGRRRLIANAITAIIESVHRTDPSVLVVMERSWVGPAASALLPLHGVVVDAIERTGAALCHVSPPALKRFGAGNGKAGKPEMIAAAQACGYAGTSDDEADAYLLALLGHHLLGGTDHASPHRASCLAAVEWEIRTYPPHSV